jgi:hypothetical protein
LFLSNNRELILGDATNDSYNEKNSFLLKIKESIK